MDFKIQKETLLPALKQVSSVVEGKNTMPILFNALLSIDSNDTLTITATDLEIQIVSSVTVDDNKSELLEGVVSSVTTPAKKLLDTISAMPKESVIRFKLDTETGKLKISSKKSRYTLSTLSSDDYPKFQSTILDSSLIIDTDKLLNALTKTAFCMGKDDIRYYLNGAMLSITENKIEAVASDGHRMAMCNEPIYCENGISEPGQADPQQIIVPRKAVLELIKVLTLHNKNNTQEEADKTLKVEFNRDSFRVEFNSDSSTVFSTKLIDSKYPRFDRVFTQSMLPVISVKSDTLKASLRRVMILANEKFNGVEISALNNELMIKTNNPDREEADDTIDCDYSGIAFDIGFNATYMIDCMSAIKTDNAIINVTENMSAIIIEPDVMADDNEGNSDDNYKYVVMPMRL